MRLPHRGATRRVDGVDGVVLGCHQHVSADVERLGKHGAIQATDAQAGCASVKVAPAAPTPARSAEWWYVGQSSSAAVSTPAVGAARSSASATPRVSPSTRRRGARV